MRQDLWRGLTLQEETGYRLKRFLASANHIIVIVNVLVFLMTDLFLTPEQSGEVVSAAALNSGRVLENKEFYRILTYMFLHGDISHIMGNMLMIFLIGDFLENYFGTVRYVIIYFSTGVLAGVTSMVYNILTFREVYSIGASGAGFGLMGALIALLIINRGHIAGVTLPRMLVYVAISLYTGVRSTGIDNAAHAGGLMAGLLVGLILVLLENRKRRGATL